MRFFDDLKKGLIIGIILGGVFTFLFIYFLNVLIIDLGQGDSIANFWDNQQVKSYERVAEYWQEEELTKSLAYLCLFQQSEIEKVKCVHHYVNSTFRYTMHGVGNQLRDSPEEAITKGMVCRDATVLYASVLKLLNINYEYIHEPSHVYLVVYPMGYSCRLDINYLGCTEN